MSDSTTIDDGAELVSYAGQWNLLQGSAGANGGTLHSTTSPGSSASLSFSGDSISVFAAVQPCTTAGAQAVVSFAIDGAVILSRLIRCSTETQTGVNVFSSSGLSQGSHSITVTYGGKVAPFQLDMFVYGSGTALQNTPTTTPGGASSSSSSSSSASSSATTSSSSGSSSSASSVSGSTSSVTRSTTGAPALASYTTMMINGSITSVILASPTGNTTHDGGVLNHPPPGSRGPPIAPITASILGTCVVILIVLYSIMRHRKRRVVVSQRASMPGDSLTPFDDLERSEKHVIDSVESPPQEAQSSSSHIVTPFLEKNPLEREYASTSDLQHSSGNSTQHREDHSESQEHHHQSDSLHLPSSDEKHPITIPTESSSTLSSQPSLTLFPPPPPPPPDSESIIAPAYASGSRHWHYRSGLSHFSDNRASQILDVPPSYESVRNANAP